MRDSDPELDDYLIVRLDKPGDFSTYTLRLVGSSTASTRATTTCDFSFKVELPQRSGLPGRPRLPAAGAARNRRSTTWPRTMPASAS